jgi:hypothetical protein
VAGAALAGKWGIDDEGELRLNGNLLSVGANDYLVATPFSAVAGSGFFQTGTHTLTITMTSGGQFL